ncbi:hypothetical protein D0Z07_0216 [Hyphodiscus hymeniophilus]|uniref:Uncharacterized protein n=1 Tax=Hyphodiscus hymeniophilus TaxID=353542 RepID=A0A9P7B186_9HELO|nr:hypothetical protein D0Z07_0216 [Hyphodiscus hymeniophilus]
MDRRFPSSRKLIGRSFAAFLAIFFLAYIIWFPIGYMLAALSSLFRHHSKLTSVLDPGVDQDCNIKQTDIYLSPLQPTPLQFCDTRASLLESLSNGLRHGFDEPYFGKGTSSLCIPTDEICMVLERFHGIIFIGDDISRAIYLAFNMLLREDLVYGALKGPDILSDQDRNNCRCDNQFLDECSSFGISSSEDLEMIVRSGSGCSYYSCHRIPHAYIPVDTFPASPSSIAAFKDLTYQKPNPWQPSPVVFSFGHASSFDIEMSTSALDEWLALALAAERNIPVLFLSPPAIGTPESNTVVWQFHQRMSTVAKLKHVDVLGLYNLTLQATSMNEGRNFGGRVALAEAMMIINWLSKLETS